MTLLEQTTAFIGECEGFSAKPYPDGPGRYTNGFGTEAKTPTEEITREEGLKRLEEYVKPRLDMISKNTALNSNQIIALTSLAYNIGDGGYKRSAVAACVNKGDWKGAAAAFALYNKFQGKVLSGLVSRRAKESKLFSTPV